MTNKQLPPRLAAIVAALPAALNLTICREGREDAKRQYFPETDPGCWLACAPITGGYGGAWGRSMESAEDAIRKALAAGGKPLAKAKGDPQLLLYWQPEEAWIAHAKLYPDRAPEVGPPSVGNDGSTFWWGSPALHLVYAPARKEVRR